ncbi:MAG: phosphotransferase [Bradymonadaceae bacterium]
MRVVLPIELATDLLTGPLKVGEKLANLKLLHDDGAASLPTLIVKALHSDDGYVIDLYAADDEARSALWLAVDRVTRGFERKPVAEASKTGVDSIPARGQHTEAARQERLDFIRRESGVPLTALQQTSLLPKRLTSNIENLVGSVEIPVGIAGPLLFRGGTVEGVTYAPLATTEGTLVASASRGARALTRAGGVITSVLGQRMLRSPLFVLSTLEGAMLFARWLSDHEEEIGQVIREVSGHARLIELKTVVLGRHVHVSFLYETGDAAGQNMTTTCTWHACQWLLRKMAYFDEVEFENFVVEANMSSDKKVTYQSFVSGRGTRVIAEAFLDRDTIESVLKVSPEQLLRTNHAFMAGSIQAGMVGFNINVANIIAAVFTATGQDIGCVHESSLGQFYLEQEGDGIVASLLLPGIIVGTVGGGTQLPRQQDYLDLMGCAGTGKGRRLAEIIAGFCLALDLSTLSAIAGGQFAQAHERLGRNRPVQWFRREDLDADFFEAGLRESFGDPNLEVTAVEELSDVEPGSSIITELTSRKVKKLVGHFPINLHYQSLDGVPVTLPVITKVKPIDEEIVLMLSSMASLCGPAVAETFARRKASLDFTACDAREVAIYRQTDPRFLRHAPKVFGTHQNASREIFIVVLELLSDVILLDTADDVSGWEDEHIVAALEGIAEIHAIWYEKASELREKPWIGTVQTSGLMSEMSDLWGALADHARQEFPEWISEDDRVEIREIVEDIPTWWAEYEKHPTTLIHNDFNPRNICLRRTSDGPRLCAYDWELATIAPPQRDLAEFLAFILPADVEEERVTRYVEVHRRALEKATGKTLDPHIWRQGYALSLLDLTVNRFGLYLMAHTFRHYGFMERAVATLGRLRAIERARQAI